MCVKRNLESTVKFKAIRKDQHELILIPEFITTQFLLTKKKSNILQHNVPFFNKNLILYFNFFLFLPVTKDKGNNAFVRVCLCVFFCL